jgi:hypothetical protein
MNLLPSQIELLDVAGGATTIGTSSYGAIAHLSVQLVNSNSITLNGSTPLGSVSPLFGGYDGYSSESVTWQPPGVNVSGAVEVIGTIPTFRPSDATNPQNMYGVVVTDQAGANLLFAAPFDQVPLPMQSSLNSITLTFSYQPITNSVVVTVTA